MDTAASLVWLLVAVFIGFVIFLICRELLLWYWKINQTLAVLNEIKETLLVIANKLPNPPTETAVAPPSAMQQDVTRRRPL